MLKLPTSDGVCIIDDTTIIRIQSISNYSKLFFNNGKTLVVAKVLAWFEDQLSSQLFVRVHRSHLVSLQYVHKYCNRHNSRIILHDNTAIDVSRRKKRAVISVFRNKVAA